ncbi:hypothetical protein [Nocardia abscessus]|uniref:hypothetical protein n=1 Tax=Nocardia abscessus TaxID=120957 RepID=UPI0012F92D9E|nr:hypothetical protein [Nocardia abscessus]MCC3328332.1 hypothetical protein [Nocardia abscessus]
MRINVTVLAKAQGLGDDFDYLQRLRRGKGITSADDMGEPTHFVMLNLLNITRITSEQLTSGLENLKELIDYSPPHDRKLLRLCFNFNHEYGYFNWLDRAENFALDNAWIGSSRTVRHRADLALLQLLMRCKPAAEPEPIPRTADTATDANSEPVNSGRANSAQSFFGEDYVRNSKEFISSWQHAHQVDMCGFGHNRMAVAYSGEINELLRNGGKVRVLMQDPDGKAVLDANRRSSTPKASDESVRHQHRSGAATLHAILAASGAPSSALQIRIYDIMPPFTGYFFDPEAGSARAYIWFWSWRQPSSWRPGFSLSRADDPIWYDRFQSQFDAMWNDEETLGIGPDRTHP